MKNQPVTVLLLFLLALLLRAVIRPDEKFSISSYSGLRNYSPTFLLQGKNIKLRGRGILDASGCTTHSRNMIVRSL